MATEEFLPSYSQFLDSSGGHLTHAALSTYINAGDDLSTKERQFVTRHLDSCSECRARLREVEEFEGNVHVLHPARHWTLAPAFRYAIAAMVILALGSAITWYITREEPLHHVVQSSPSPEAPLAAQEIDPARFAPHPVLEGFVGRTERSASASTFRIPSPGDTVQIPFLLEWGGTKRNSTLTLLDNTNREILAINTKELQARIDTTLAPGLYYAKLTANGNLVSVTKFYVVAK